MLFLLPCALFPARAKCTLSYRRRAAQHRDEPALRAAAAARRFLAGRDGQQVGSVAVALAKLHDFISGKIFALRHVYIALRQKHFFDRVGSGKMLRFDAFLSGR